MRWGRRHAALGVITIAAASAVGVVLGPGQGQASSAASFTASDFHWQVTGTTDTSVTIAPGQSVTFSYPSGASMHDADFSGGPAPGSCTQTAGASSGATPPLPHQPTTQGWSGSCAFPTAGNYTFHCDLHPSMTGTIVVGNSTSSSMSTTTSTTSTITSATSTSAASSGISLATTMTPGPGAEPQPGGANVVDRPAATWAVALAARQRGVSVRGSVTVPARGSRLEIDLVTDTGSGSRRSGGPRLVGRLARRSAAAGVVRFSVAVSSGARRQLRRQRILRLIVTVALTPPDARTVVRSSQVTLTA